MITISIILYKMKSNVIKPVSLKNIQILTFFDNFIIVFYSKKMVSNLKFLVTDSRIRILYSSLQNQELDPFKLFDPEQLLSGSCRSTQTELIRTARDSSPSASTRMEPARWDQSVVGKSDKSEFPARWKGPKKEASDWSFLNLEAPTLF